jgi:septal ring factor EnvC (AmiA/AmiB activator)
MKIFIFLSIFVLAIWGQDTEVKIKNTQSEVYKKAKAYKNIYSKISQISQSIKKEKKKLRLLNSDIKILKHKLTKSSKELDTKKTSLEDTKKLQKEILDRKQKLELELVNYLTKDLSLSMIIKKIGNQDLNEVIQEEVFTKYNDIIKKKLKGLVLDIGKHEELLQKVVKKVDSLTEFIETNKLELAKLKDLKTKRENSVKDYQKQRDEYSVQLDSITKQKNNLSKILKNLKVLKNKEDERARKEEQERIRQAKIEKQKAEKKDTNNIVTEYDKSFDIRKLGSSYQKARVTRYRGKKYSPPIKRYKIVKKFGTYVDPVYKIKIFNDAIILKSTVKNQKVRTVLTGKVIYAKKMPTLGNVVIIKHKNGIHTTYAQLDSIATGIRKGKWLKTGYVIGRVSDELSFQAVKNDKYINPIRFIHVK